jgi:dihydrofolate reductase
MKNHRKVDGKLLQMNKKYSQLKHSQKEFIATELYAQCKAYVMEKGVYPNNKHNYDIVDAVMEKIEERQIWIPEDEVHKHLISKETKYRNKMLKEGLIVEDNGKFVFNKKIILYIAMSLDGYIADESGGVDWLEEYANIEDTDYEEFYKTIDTVIMGRKTYDQVLGFGEYPYLNVKSYVYSKTRSGTDENVGFIQIPPVDLVKSLKQQSGKHVWLIGGADLIHDFIEDNLIDEYQITILPVILGNGIPLFKSGDHRVGLELRSKKNFKDVVALTYRNKITGV